MGARLQCLGACAGTKVHALLVLARTCWQLWPSPPAAHVIPRAVKAAQVVVCAAGAAVFLCRLECLPRCPLNGMRCCEACGAGPAAAARWCLWYIFTTLKRQPGCVAPIGLWCCAASPHGQACDLVSGVRSGCLYAKPLLVLAVAWIGDAC